MDGQDIEYDNQSDDVKDFYCSDCGMYIGLFRSDMKDLICDECYDERLIEE